MSITNAHSELSKHRNFLQNFNGFNDSKQIEVFAEYNDISGRVLGRHPDPALEMILPQMHATNTPDRLDAMYAKLRDPMKAYYLKIYKVQ